MTREDSSIRAPAVVNQAAAGSGNSSLKRHFGSSRSAEPVPLNKASRSTRKNTVALASDDGVFSAATHSGSIKSVRTEAGRAAVNCATVIAGSQRKPRSIQTPACASKRSRSLMCQPLCARTPRAKASAGAPGGRHRPRPSGPIKRSGMRTNACGGSAPTRRIKRSVSVYAPIKMCWPLSNSHAASLT